MMTTEAVPPRVCVRIVGGLGNQMFGAAAGMALASRIGGRLELDAGYFATHSTHTYQLNSFGFSVPVHTFSPPLRRSRLSRLLGLGAARSDAPPEWPGAVFRERGFHYDDRFETVQGDVYLNGYFQSWLYFAPIADKVRARFNLVPHLSDEGRRFAAMAVGDGTIAMHVRRGDYAHDAATTAYHGLMGRDYYERALALVARSVPGARVLVVSDEPDAARELVPADVDAISVSGTTALDDMHIIGACRHKIIANSSFSWWGAWLDPRADGVTVAPRNWFARRQLLTMYTGDLIPLGWVLV